MYICIIYIYICLYLPICDILSCAAFPAGIAIALPQELLKDLGLEMEDRQRLKMKGLIMPDPFGICSYGM